MILAIQCLNRNRGIQEILLNLESRADLSLNNSEDLKLIQEKINEEIERRITANGKFTNRRYESANKR